MLGDPTFRHWRAGLCLCLMTIPVWGAGFIVDGDGDGVPFEIDECPYTRPGQPVDARGCSDLPDADEDGIPDVDDRCPVSAVGASIDPDGCAIDGDGDGIPDGIDQCPGTPISTVPGSTGCSAAQRLALGEPRVIVGRPVTGRPMPSPDRAVAAAPDRLNTQAQADVSSAFHDESSVAMQATKPAAPEAGAIAALPGLEAVSAPVAPHRSGAEREPVGVSRRLAPVGRGQQAFQSAIGRVLWGIDPTAPD